MKFKAILMGHSANLVAQAEILFGFIRSNLASGNILGETVVLTTRQAGQSLVMDQALTEKIDLVRVADYRAETILNALQNLEFDEKADLYIFPNSRAGDDMAVRWAYRINGSSLVQVKSIDLAESGLQAQKAVYANHVRATFRMIQSPYCISLAKDGLEPETIPIRDKINVTEHDLSKSGEHPQFISSEWIPDVKTADLENSQFLVVGGRGMGSAGASRELEILANAMGAEFGVSRPVAMSAWAPMHRLIGISGAIAGPRLCIAAGVSGAAAFYAGVAGSKKIIAINSDANAPITTAADVVIIEDYKAIMKALVKIVLEAKTGKKQSAISFKRLRYTD